MFFLNFFLSLVEVMLWIYKWKKYTPDQRPITALDALTKCDYEIFPTIRLYLQILATLPVSVVYRLREVFRLYAELKLGFDQGWTRIV